MAVNDSTANGSDAKHGAEQDGAANYSAANYSADSLSRQRCELWSLREDVDVELEPDGPVRLGSRWGEFTLPQPPPAVREALHRMRLGPISLTNVPGAGPDASMASPAARTQLIQLYQVLEQLAPLVVRTARLDTGQPLLSVIPMTVSSVLRPVPLPPDVPIRLSTFAELRTDGREFRLESPLALHRVLLHRAEAVTVMGLLAQPTTPEDLAKAMPQLNGALAVSLDYLAAAGIVVVAEPPSGGHRGSLPVFAEDSDPALTSWSTVDLTFHVSSTMGRHDHDFGATYQVWSGRAQGSGEPPVKPPLGRPVIALHRPDWDDLCATDPPLVAAIEGRRSVRRHDGPPVTVTELGDLLYRTARVRNLGEGTGAGPAVPGRRLSDRPYPAAGACYELELYVTAGQCDGLAPGVYHYDPLGHQLELVSDRQDTVRELLLTASTGAVMDGPPHLLITLTARTRRLSWKYQGPAYALVLMDAGVLIQTLYLVCTAMRLAACAVGTASSELTARAFGTDWRTEPGISQFVVGRSAAGADSRPGAWQPANDPAWPQIARAYLGSATT